MNEGHKEPSNLQTEQLDALRHDTLKCVESFVDAYASKLRKV